MWAPWLCLAMLAEALAVHRVAIVGAGMGGSHTAFWLRKLAKQHGHEISIDVYERKSRAGGRALAERVLDSPVEIEVGASMMIRQNKYMLDAAQMLGLRVEFKNNPRFGPKTFIIWDGHKARFIESESKIVTIGKIAYHFGPWSFYKLVSAASKFIDKFGSIYALQDDGVAFESAQALWSSMGLLSDVAKNCSDMLQESLGLGPSSTIVDDLVGGLMRNNYNQMPAEAGGLVCMTSIAPLAAGGSAAAWSVVGGNQLIADGLLSEANATVKYRTFASKVFRGSDKTLQLEFARKEQVSSETSSGDAAESSATLEFADYEAVVIATPQSFDGGQTAQIAIDLEDGFSFSGFNATHQEVHVTFAAGKLSTAHFGLPSSRLNELRDILIPVSTTTKYNSIGRAGAQKDGTPIWKFFSTAKLEESDLRPLFEGTMSSIVRYQWRAYPRKCPSLPPIKLADGVFYVSAAEYGTSAMEVMAVAGRNAALLTADYLGFGSKKKASDSKRDDL